MLEAKAWAARRPKSAPEPTALHLDFIRASEEEAEARLSEQRKQLEAMAAAQAERETALHEAEEALKQAADAQRKRARIRNIALVVVSILAVVAGLLGWNADQQRMALEKAQNEFARSLDELSKSARIYVEAGVLSNNARRALFAKEFPKALVLVEQAHALRPERLNDRIHRAHALMFIERGDEAKMLYISTKGRPTWTILPSSEE